MKEPPRIIQLNCIACGTMLTTVNQGDARHQKAHREGMNCATCGKVQKVTDVRQPR